MKVYDSTQIDSSFRPMLEITRAYTLARAQGPHRKDAIRGYYAYLLNGRGELDTTQAPWGNTARALVRASYFNQGVREARRRLAEQLIELRGRDGEPEE